MMYRFKRNKINLLRVTLLAFFFPIFFLMVSVNVSDAVVIFQEDFEGYTPGDRPGNPQDHGGIGYTFIEPYPDGMGQMSVQAPDPDHGSSGQRFGSNSLLIQKPTAGSPAPRYHAYTLGSNLISPYDSPHTTGAYTISWKAYAHQESGFGTSIASITDLLEPTWYHALTLDHTGGGTPWLIYMDGDGQHGAVPYQANLANDFKVVLNLDTGTYDLYIDDVRYANQRPVQDSNFASLYRFSFAIGGTDPAAYNIDDIFIETEAQPSVTTLQPTGVTDVTATLNGTVNANGLDTTYLWEIDDGTVSVLIGHTLIMGGATLPISADYDLSAINPGTTIQYRIRAYNSLGESFGEWVTFTTLGAVVDTDGDGLTDTEETGTYNTNPNNPDTDGDGLWDGDEVNIYGTLPNAADTDGDGFEDFLEVLRDSNPLQQLETPVWQNDTFVRRIESGQLESVVASYGYKQSNSLLFADPTSFGGFESEVTVTEIHARNAHVRARLGGYFYSIDGGRDVFAEVGVRQTSLGLRAFYEIGSCGDVSCSDWEDITFLDLGPATLNQTYLLSLSYDQVFNRFTFGFDGNYYLFDGSGGLPTYNGPPSEEIRLVGTRVGGGSFGTDSGGFVRALFDNVRVNDPIEGWILKDSFTGPRIDQDNWLPSNDFNWQRWEFVRSADGGAIESAVANYTNNQGNTLVLQDPDTIGGFETDVSVTDFDNNAAWVGARAIGALYNDGTPGAGERTGDIIALVGVEYDGTDLNGYYAVVRCLSGACSLPGEYEQLFYAPDFFAAASGGIYTVGMNWNPATNSIQFSYSYFDGGLYQGAAFVPNLPAPVSPPKVPFKGVGTRVSSIDAAGEYGYVAALFENVTITNVLSSDDFDGDGTADVYDPDDDNDGLDDVSEGVFGTDPYDPDTDGDLFEDGIDNCPGIANPAGDWYDGNNDLHKDSQPDYDLDGEGDACDDDDDNDGDPDGADNCPFKFNPNQEDDDTDGLGNACDPDADGDRYVSWEYYQDGVIEPNCNPGTPDPACLNGYDCDDAVPNIDSDPEINGNCITSFKPNKNTTIEDSDEDNVVDTSDNCPNDPNEDQFDSDDDGIGDACDTCPNDADNDIDNDGICGDVDICPTHFNANSDIDGDGIDDACDKDADGDRYISPAYYEEGVIEPNCNPGATDPSCLAEADCNDLNASVNPGAEEIADLLDNNCDGEIDEGQNDYAVRFEIIGDDISQTIYKNWLPAHGATVTVRAFVVDVNGDELSIQPTITLEAFATTFSGDYTNHSEVHETPDFDVDITANNPQFTLTALDYGGSVRVQASASVDQGDANTFTALGEFKLPRDTDNDGLADTFEIEKCGNLVTLNSADGDFDNDGISNINEIRGFFWGPANMEIDPQTALPGTAYYGWYQTPALVPDGPVEHFRTDPTLQDLFIRVTGYSFADYDGEPLAPDYTNTGLVYNPGFDLSVPADRADLDTLPDAQFAMGWAFKSVGVDVHVASSDYAPVDLSTLENHIDVLELVNNLMQPLSGDGHTFKFGIRDGTWSPKGESTIGYVDENALAHYAAYSATYQLPLDYMFSDRMWMDDLGNQTADMLDWLDETWVEDKNDNGLDDYIKKEKMYESEAFTNPDIGEQFDGDLFAFGYDGNLTIFDIDNDGYVELPFADIPTLLDPEGLDSGEYTKPQVLKHTITHECGHAINMDHTAVPTCAMYNATPDWAHDKLFSDSAKAVMRIHNR